MHSLIYVRSPWVVRYRTTGGRASRQREQSFGGDLREAEDFALKVEHDKRARTFVDPKAGQALFRAEAATWLDHYLGADRSKPSNGCGKTTRVGDAAGCDAYLDGLRECQRRKYSFFARLDAAFGTDGSSAYG